jgi:hypothetical protein
MQDADATKDPGRLASVHCAQKRASWNDVRLTQQRCPCVLVRRVHVAEVKLLVSRWAVAVQFYKGSNDQCGTYSLASTRKYTGFTC